MRPMSNCILQHFPRVAIACESLAIGGEAVPEGGSGTSYQYGFGDEEFDEAPLVALVPGQECEPDVHVLFIGADAGLAETYRMKLNLDGYRTTVLTTEREARTLAASIKPDLIYLDLTSAAGWGLKVLQGLRKREATRSTPVLLLVKFPSKERPSLGPHDFLVPVRLAFDQLQGASRRRRLRV
jgi:CheY-like chemotaxis protein